MMFTLVVPLVFFSIASAVAGMSSAARLGKIMGSMLGVFAVTGIIASIVMVAALRIFNATDGVQVEMQEPENVEDVGSIGDQLVQTVVVDDFSKILSAEHMLALIVFAVIVGFATSRIGEAGKPFAQFLNSGTEVFLKFTSIVMYYAPIGLGAYFAALIGDLGSQLVGDYVRAFLVYYPVAIAYFILAFTFYSFLAGGRRGVSRFWGNILEPTAISLGTSSSVAAIPANLRAGEKIRSPVTSGRRSCRSVPRSTWKDRACPRSSRSPSSLPCSSATSSPWRTSSSPSPWRCWPEWSWQESPQAASSASS